ncbi:MAG: hypothetical protein HQL97_01175, partial [Magnetococcales bacterium]|nr:hypothetical protein [Magnetococcales bacterium]
SNGSATEDERRSNGSATEDERRSNGSATEGYAPFNQPEPEPYIKSKSSPTPREAEIFDLPPEIPAEAWQAWIEHLKSKQPNWRPTSKAKQLSLNRLMAICAKNHDPAEVIGLAMRCGWSDFHEPTPDFDKGKTNHGKANSTHHQPAGFRPTQADLRRAEYDRIDAERRLQDAVTIDGEIVRSDQA